MIAQRSRQTLSVNRAEHSATNTHSNPLARFGIEKAFTVQVNIPNLVSLVVGVAYLMAVLTALLGNPANPSGLSLGRFILCSHKMKFRLKR